MNNNKPLRHPASHSKGITLVEILLVLGLLVILLSFAIPSVSGAAVKAEMNATLENVRYSLQMAQKVARTTESTVVVSISPARPDFPQTIAFKPGKGGSRVNLQIQDFTVPADVVLVTEQDSFVFDERGLVQNPGHILLVSRVDETVTSTVQIR